MAQIASVRTSSADWLSCEVKHRRELPRWLTDALAAACHASEPGQLAVAIFHEHQRNRSQALVVMTLGDFSAWFAPEVGGG